MTRPRSDALVELLLLPPVLEESLLPPLDPLPSVPVGPVGVEVPLVSSGASRHGPIVASADSVGGDVDVALALSLESPEALQSVSQGASRHATIVSVPPSLSPHPKPSATMIAGGSLRKFIAHRAAVDGRDRPGFSKTRASAGSRPASR